MAARKKKATRKKAAKRASASRAIARLEPELPANLREYARQVRRRLTQVEREIDRAEAQARRRFTRLLRNASHELGHLEARGQAEWRKLTNPYRRRAVSLLKKLEKAVAPPARKKAARKKARKKTGRRKTATALA